MTLIPPSRLLSLALLLAAGPAAAISIDSASVTNLSVAQESNGHTGAALAVSHNGRYAVFVSYANNLIAVDTNHRADLFLYDAQGDSVERVSLRDSGEASMGGSIDNAAVTDDGRYVFFSSTARDLVAGVDQGTAQIYVRDRVAGTTQLVSQDGNGAPLDDAIVFNGISADGRYVLLASVLPLLPADTNDLHDLYRLDRSNGTYALVSAGIGGVPANRFSTTGKLSADGHHVAFNSSAVNLVAGDTPGTNDLFLRDVDAGTTLLASRTTAGSFFSGYRQPMLATGASLSVDGRYVVFNTAAALDPLDTNGRNDGYLFDRDTLSVRRITLASTGGQIADEAMVNSISADGSVVTFTSPGAVLPGQSAGISRSYRRALAQVEPQPIVLRPPGQVDAVSACHLAGDASVAYCQFQSGSAHDLFHNSFVNLYLAAFPQTDVRRVSRPLDTPSAVANHDSGFFSVSASADGRYVVFDSVATNLVVGDLNGRRDVFLRDRVAGTTERINRLPGGGESPCGATRSQISADGRYIVFESCAHLVPGIVDNGYQQILRYDRASGVIAVVSRNAQGAIGNNISILRDISSDGGVVGYVSLATNLLAVPGNPYGDSYVSDLNAGTVEAVSRRADGQSAGAGLDLQLSATGRYAVFSHTLRLVPADTNDVEDVYVFDRLTAQTERVNLDAAGNQLEERGSTAAGISADGRLVLFGSYGAVPGAGGSGFYVRDRVSGALDLVSVDSDGEPLGYYGGDASMSDDGALVAQRCLCDGDDGTGSLNYNAQPYVFDRRSRHLQRITPTGADNPADQLKLIGNGDYLVFNSSAGNLVAGEGNNHFLDAFIASNFGDVLFADGLGDE